MAARVLLSVGMGDSPRTCACPECGRTGHVTPTRREQLIQKVEAWKAASLNRPMLVSPCDVTIGVAFNTDSRRR